jgi:hypothetical protein
MALDQFGTAYRFLSVKSLVLVLGFLADLLDRVDGVAGGDDVEVSKLADGAVALER